MPDPNFVILYVDDAASAATFMLGLWTKGGVQPAATPPGGGELGFSVADAAAVEALHGEWHKRGLKITQAPTEMDFGRTFVALDPDGHRLRVFAPR
jgi:predicted enzyme related to lactoylglutathione lyase